MINKRIAILLLTIVITIPLLRAQSYTVYSVIGSVNIVQGKTTIPLAPRTQLSAKSSLMIEQESAVTLLDEKQCRLYSFSIAGVHSVEQLVKMSKSKSLTKQYLNYLIKQLFADGSSRKLHPERYMQASTTSYRAVEVDSMLISRIVQMIPESSNLSPEQILCEPTTPMNSDMKVRFELISCESGRPIMNLVNFETSCYARIYNDSEEPLYVNILDIDEKGEKYLVLPVDEAGTCAHLLVPPLSTVSFKSEPFIFPDNKTKETFILIATQEPVDFSILMDPITGTCGKAMKSGIYRQIYEVRD